MAISFQPKIAVLGAGLIGRMLALNLARRYHQQYQIELFDSDDTASSQSTAFLAAAMLAPVAESVEASELVCQLGEHSLTLWPEFLASLDNDVFFQQNGSLILSYGQDAPLLQDFKQRIKTHYQPQLEVLNPQQLAQYEPFLAEQTNRFSGGLFLAGEAQLDNRQLLNALKSSIQNSAVVWHPQHKVEQLEGQDFTTHCHGQIIEHHAEWIFDCRGLGAKQSMAENHAESLQLRGVRGEVIRLHAPAVDLQRPVRLMHPRYPIYIAPKQNHHFVVGATQIESEDQRQPTVRSAMELLSSCFSLHPGFAEAEILEIESGLRPALPNNDPRIIVKDRLIQINGLYRHGYLTAPAVIEAAMKIFAKQNRNGNNIEPELNRFAALIEYC